MALGCLLWLPTVGEHVGEPPVVGGEDEGLEENAGKKLPEEDRPPFPLLFVGWWCELESEIIYDRFY